MVSNTFWLNHRWFAIGPWSQLIKWMWSLVFDPFTKTQVRNGKRPHGRKNWVTNLHGSIGLVLSIYVAMTQLLMMILRWCSRPCNRTIPLGELSRKWMKNRYFHPWRSLLDHLHLLNLYLFHLQMLYPQRRSWPSTRHKINCIVNSEAIMDVRNYIAFSKVIPNDWLL